VAQHLEALGHELIVADPNYAPMYATRGRWCAATACACRAVRLSGSVRICRPSHWHRRSPAN
jgi:hypothetical protein